MYFNLMKRLNGEDIVNGTLFVSSEKDCYSSQKTHTYTS